MLELFSYSLTAAQLTTLVFAAVLIGMAKTGVHGAGMVAVPMVALIFGGKASTGFILPLFIFADFFGVRFYHSHADWTQLRRLIPYALLGIVIGTIVGDMIDERVFSQMMAITIFACLALMIWQEINQEPAVPSSIWFVVSIGIIGGFTTMVGNLAGPVMALFLLAMRFPKNQFIGTAAWFFLSVNLLKVPFHLFAWETITLNSFLLNLLLLPAIAVGAYSGVYIIKLVPERPFRWLIIVMTLLAAIALWP